MKCNTCFNRYCILFCSFEFVNAIKIALEHKAEREETVTILSSGEVKTTRISNTNYLSLCRDEMSLCGSKLKAFFIFFTYICAWAAVYVVSMILYNNLFGKWEPSIWIMRALFNLILLPLYLLVFRTKVEKSGTAIEKAAPMPVAVSGMAYFLLPILMLMYAFNEQNNLSLAATIFLLVISVSGV